MEHWRGSRFFERVWAFGLAAGGKPEPPDEQQIEICREWIREWCERRSSFGLRHSSYGLKHIVENWAGAYVTNGAFIQAAIEEGYDFRQLRRGPNAVFRMSTRRWDDSVRRAMRSGKKLPIRDSADWDGLARCADCEREEVTESGYSEDSKL